MLTSRGWWFLITVAFLLAVGALVIPYYTTVPAILAVTLLAWFVYEWVRFNIQSNAAVPKLQMQRVVLQNGRDTPMLWANVPFEVCVSVEHNGRVTIDYAVIDDRLPPGADILKGDTDLTTRLRSGEPADVRYTLRCPAPGVLRFEGVKVRVADLHGFFYRRVFLRNPVEYLVLPPLVDDEGRQRADKRFNTLPPPGIHRWRRPGSGDELLDLRDYRPGDPPKMIAWKPSARKDKLITKEYENDVPVRCVLFLDTSDGVRLGPAGNTLLTRMAGVAAVVAQASAANRDLIGLTTFDDKNAAPLRPARTQTHMITVLQRLAEVASLQPTTKAVPLENLTNRAYPLAHELYPELMSKRVNTMPLGRLWIPMLERWWGWIVLFLIVFPVALAAYKINHMLGGPSLGPFQKIYHNWMADTFDFAVRKTPHVFWPLRIALALIIWLVTLCWPSIPPALFWFFYGARGWFGTSAQELTKRKQLATLFCLQDGTGPDGIERYLHDDSVYAKRVTLFLEQHRLRVAVPLYDDHGRYRFKCAGKADVLAYEMVRAVSRARDNELYVLLADLSELGDDLEPLVKACRVARARRHHVMVIVPWPADVPSPDETPPEPARSKRERHRDDFDFEVQSGRISRLVQQSLTKQYHESFRKMRKALSRVGATVMTVNDGDPVRMVLDRLDRLRGMRSRR